MSRKRYAIGADIGGTNIRVALLNERGTIEKRIKKSTADRAVDSLLDAIHQVSGPTVTGIGIGIAGIIDRETGVVRSSPNLPSVEGTDLKHLISQTFSIPVFVENDANVAALGEKWTGAARDFSSFVLLTLGTGIGGGIVCADQLMDVAAELGHIAVEADGLGCPCGNTGCLESYASARAMISRVIDSLEKGSDSLMKNLHGGNVYKISPEDIYSSALEGDILARETLKLSGRYLGIGIANIVNIFSPEAVVLGGGLIGAWNIYVEAAIREASRRAFPELFERVKVLPSRLKDDAGVVGAASLVFRPRA